MTTISGVSIGPGQPCRVVAELSNAHNGDLALALRLIEECAAAGADFVKFQCYTPDELVRLRGDGPAPEPWGSQGWTMRRLYEKAQTPHAWFPRMIARCNEVGVPWFSSVFGEESLAILDFLNCPAFKVAALDVGSGFAAELASWWEPQIRRPPIIASSRGERIPWADLTLYCPPGYPQSLDDMRPDRLHELFSVVGGPGWVGEPAVDGFSYHGTEWTMPAFAAEYGAQLVEVHVQLDDEPSELERDVSLTVSQLRQLCDSAHKARAA